MPITTRTQDLLKERYGINKNISASLSPMQQEELLVLLEASQTVRDLVDSFRRKNDELNNNNRRFGQQRKKVQDELTSANQEKDQLASFVSSLYQENVRLRKLLRRTIDRAVNSLTEEMLPRSEVVSFLKALRNLVSIPKEEG